MTKVTIFNFPKKMALANLSRNYKAFCFVIHFNDFSKHCIIVMGYLKQTIVTVSFFKKIPCRGKWMICVQFGPKIQHLASHDLPVFFLRNCSMMGQNKQKIVMRDNFPKKSSFQSKEKFRSNSAQNYLIIYLFFETFWNDGT